MPKKLPYLDFHTGDWLTDTRVSLCSPATRGIWLDLLCVMHETQSGGEVRGIAADLATLCRCTESEVLEAVEELRRHGTADITEQDGVYTIISRRMQRDAYASSIDGMREWIRANYKLLVDKLTRRDGYVCQHCGRTSNLAIDHRKSLVKGGCNGLRNLQFLCKSCNSRKGAK